MAWIAGAVDGTVVKRRSIIGTGEWSAAKDKMIELLAAQLSDRLDMGESVADSFADGGDVSGGVCTSGYVTNTESGYVPAVPAQSAANVVPAMSSNTSPSGYVASASTIESSNYDAYKAFDGTINVVSNVWSALTVPQWLRIKIPTAKIVDLYKIYFRNYGSYDPFVWQFQGSNNGSNWVTLDSRSGVVSSGSLGEVKSFSFSNSTAYSYYRLYITSVEGGGSWTNICELQIFSKAIPYTPAIPANPDPTTITVSPYTPDSTLEKVRVTLMLQDMAHSGMLAVGRDSTDLVQAYLSYDGNSSFGSALSFSEEPHELTAGSNIYVFNSDEVDVSAASISSLGLKLQSFNRGAGAPAFRWHAYIIAGKEGV